MRPLFLARDIFNGSEKSRGFSTAVWWIKDLTFSEKTQFLILKWNAILQSERYDLAIKSGRHEGADSACVSCTYKEKSWERVKRKQRASRSGAQFYWNSWKLIETFTEITGNKRKNAKRNILFAIGTAFCARTCRKNECNEHRLKEKKDSLWITCVNLECVRNESWISRCG